MNNRQVLSYTQQNGIEGEWIEYADETPDPFKFAPFALPLLLLMMMMT